MHCRLYEAPSRRRSSGVPPATQMLCWRRDARPLDTAGDTSSPQRSHHCEGGRDCILRTKWGGDLGRNAKLLMRLFLTYYTPGQTRVATNKGHTNWASGEGRGALGVWGAVATLLAPWHTHMATTVDLPPRCEEAAADFSVGARGQCAGVVLAAFRTVQRGTRIFFFFLLSRCSVYRGMW